MYRSRSPSYIRFLRTSAERDADPGSVAVRANAEEEKESTQVESQLKHFPLEKGNTVMPSGRLPSPRSRPMGSRTALKPADDKARFMMLLKAECRGKQPALRRHERGCRPYLSTMAPQRHYCGAQTLILCTKPFGDGAMDDGGRLRIELAASSSCSARRWPWSYGR